MKPSRRSVFHDVLFLVASFFLVWICLGAWDAAADHTPVDKGLAWRRQPPPTQVQSSAPHFVVTGPTDPTDIANITDTDVSGAGLEGIQTLIDDAATTYDASQIPRIAVFLQHADAEGREAALQGLLTLGDPAAAPVLRAAAKIARTSQESAALLEAADYLELPPSSLIQRR